MLQGLKKGLSLQAIGEKMKKSIGVDVNQPKDRCTDRKCPFHGNLALRGRSFVGTVVSDKMHNTAIVEWNRRHLLTKYERYEKRKTRLKVHNPECINAKEGDIVKIMECRPLSKTKNFTIIENMGKEKGYRERMEAAEQSRIKRAVKPAEEAEGQEAGN